MITENEYLEALKIVRDYFNQVSIEVNRPAKKTYGDFLNFALFKLDYPEIYRHNLVRATNGIRVFIDDKNINNDFQNLSIKHFWAERNIGKKALDVIKFAMDEFEKI